MPEENVNPFEGMDRKRLPGLHALTAMNGGVPLVEALASYFFFLMHSVYEHNCLIKEATQQLQTVTEETMLKTRNPDEAGLGMIFSAMGYSNLIMEEWAYLSEKEVVPFFQMAGHAIRTVQMFLAEGLEKPLEDPRYGPYLQIAPWAIGFFNPELKMKDRELVQKLREEVNAGCPAK